MNETFWLFMVMLAAAGACAGLMAGFFGIGGGLVAVPVFYHLLGAFDVNDDVRMHMALGTSLAMIVITSLRSVMAHARRGAVDKNILKAWLPLIAVGSLFGSLATKWISGQFLTGLFSVLILLLALRFALLTSNIAFAETLPKGGIRLVLGLGIGVLSALMGIGGGIFGVTLMTLYSTPIHRAIGTAAGFGAVIGAIGTLGFMVSGLGVEGRPPFSLGYVSLPGFLLIAFFASITTPLGARLVHSIPETIVRHLFAMLLALNGFLMLSEALTD